MREPVRAVGAGVLLAGPTILAFFSGGFFDEPRLIAALVAWALVALAAVVADRPLPSSTPGRIALAGLLLLTIWTGLSLLWAPLGGRAEDDLQRLLLYLAFFTASVALLRGAGVRRWLEPALALGAFVVVVYGLSERLLPGLIELERSRSASGRLEQPITYWNAFGAVAAIGLILAIRIAGDPARGTRFRATAAAAGLPLALGVYLSFSRGALASVAAGVLVLLALAPEGRPLLRAAIAVVGAGVAAGLVASSLSTVESLRRGESGDPEQGLLMLGVLVALSALAATVVALRPRRHGRPARLPVSRRSAVLAVSVIALLIAVVAAATLEGKPEGTSPAAKADPTRFGSIDTNRYRYWDVALDVWRENPLIGVGSGGFFVDWTKVRDRDDRSGDAHSLYLETAAELGVVGLVFLAMLLGGVGAAAVRLYRQDERAATGLAAGLAAWVVHAGLDWDWEMPALTLIALLLGAAAIAWSEGPSLSATNLRMRSTKAVVALGLLLALAAPAPALAQSAGDEQYVDPFQSGGGDTGRDPGDGNSGSQGGGSTGGDTGTATTPAPAPVESGVDDATASAPPAGGNGTALPRTGAPVAPLVVAGLLLLGAGATLRRRA